MDYSKLPSMEVIEKTIKALDQNGIRTMFLDTREDAKLKFLELVPRGSVIMNMTSMTLDTTGITYEVREGNKYVSVRNQIAKLNSQQDESEIRRLRTSAQWAVGSVHAVTEDGKILVASYSGSQLGAYAYDTPKIIWVVGVQKIVPNFEAGLERVYDYCLPKETKRIQATGGEESAVNKILVINKEIESDRIILIFVNEALGF